MFDYFLAVNRAPRFTDSSAMLMKATVPMLALTLPVPVPVSSGVPNEQTSMGFLMLRTTGPTWVKAPLR